MTVVISAPFLPTSESDNRVDFSRINRSANPAFLAARFFCRVANGVLPFALILASSARVAPIYAQSVGVPCSQPPKQTRAPANVPIKVTVGVVLADMSVRPIPLYSLELVDVADTTKRTAVRTDLTGTVMETACPGHYLVRSVQAATLNDSTYRWQVPLEVTGSGAKVELTNANAVVASAPVTKRSATRQIAPEREVFEQVKRAVFRVEAGLGHGSGFLAQIPGLAEGFVITNDHVVANETKASVYLDSVTRVPALVVARDREADLAILRLPTGRCAECPHLPLAVAKPNEPLVVAGERVFAIGFPLNQEMTLTTGIASSVREGAIISDVNINHGNSGGPMLNLAGEVIGVNAFGDFTDQGGPGISGAIAISRINALLAQVPSALAQTPAPEDRPLVAVPRTTYPLTLLKSLADSVDPSSYRKLLERDANKFTINITTPVLYRVAQRLAENDVAGDRRAREKKGGVSRDEAYSEEKQSRDWEQYVGDAAVPVVTFAIIPKVGETFWSAFGRGLSASQGYIPGQASMVFKGDVRGARFYRNGVEIEPIRGGHGSQVVRVENAWVKLKDVADMGYYVLLPEAFAPDSSGAPSRLTIVVQDLKNPGTLSVTEIDGELSARVWNDFQPYYAAVMPDKAWIAADPKQRSPKIPLTCHSEDASCEIRK
jgi:S1-C subfamily serine protease